MHRREFLITSAAAAGVALSKRALGRKNEVPVAGGEANRAAASEIGRKSQPKNKIIRLMEAPVALRDLNWLREGLQAAMEVELSTLPAYFCGLWSMVAQSGPAYNLVRSVTLQEMLHMGLACNLLTAIGTAPRIVQGYVEQISYPGPLPGGVRPELTVYLAGLTRDYLRDVYMEIEYPDTGPFVLALGKVYPTVGAFYGALLDAFRTLSPELTTENQLTSAPIGLYPIATLEDVERAITQIKEQGEGTAQSPLAEDFGGDLSHYYKFAEIYHGSELVRVGDEWQYAGDPIPFPEVYPMAPIPPGGYRDVPDDVAAMLQAFNERFSAMLSALDSAWATGSQSDLTTSITVMFQLRRLARQLMEIPLPDKSGVYGPDFVLPPI